MASLTGPLYVDAPNPIIPRYGLFRVATGPNDLPVNARIGGLQYQLSTCTLPLEYEVECQVDHNTKVIESGTPTVSGAPFIVYSAIRCDTVGLVNLGEEQLKRYLYQQLIAGEQATVERIFSTGLVAQYPNLTSGAVNLGPAQGPVQAVGILEAWLYARYGVTGVIHAPILASPYFKGSKVIYADGNPATNGIWRTATGTAVSFGNYTATGPTGDAGTWIYITGQVAIWRTPDKDLFVPPMGQVINRSTNVLTSVMEREYVITYDCFSAAVQVTLNTTDR
jgi:hypothetical protein